MMQIYASRGSLVRETAISAFTVQPIRVSKNATLWCNPNDTACSTPNPLELLRITKNPLERAKLLRDLDNNWSRFCNEYQPTTVEQSITEELGISKYNVLVFAALNPAFVEMDASLEVRPSLQTLKASGIDPNDIWFLVTKRFELLQSPIPLQRWLDFLSANDWQPRHFVTFLINAPVSLLDTCTIYQAQQVLQFLKSLGISNEFISSQIVSIRPNVFLKDVEKDLRPIILFLMKIGVPAKEIRRAICIWPDMLFTSVENDLETFLSYLCDLGCSTLQVAELVRNNPHLVSQNPIDLIKPRLEALQTLGIFSDTLKEMVAKDSDFLVSHSGISEQLNFLRSISFSDAQIRSIIVREPKILSEKLLDLENKLRFFKTKLQVDLSLFDQYPALLSENLIRVVGPRYDFVKMKGLFPNVRDLDGGIDFSKLLSGTSEEFCEMLGASANEFEGYRRQWEEDYNNQLSVDAALEFQEELKKLGIYEGR